jgi:hypothetical protein
MYTICSRPGSLLEATQNARYWGPPATIERQPWPVMRGASRLRSTFFFRWASAAAILSYLRSWNDLYIFWNGVYRGIRSISILFGTNFIN